MSGLLGKKIKVVQAVADTLKLQNVRAEHQRAENVKEKFDFVVSRAVTRMPDFLKWISKSFKTDCTNELPNGILYLKGGDLNDEMNSVDSTNIDTQEDLVIARALAEEYNI